MDKAAIVLLNFNGVALLQTYLPTLLKNSQDYPVYLIDNHSTDHSLEWINTHFSEVRCISLDRNYGYAGGYNRGLKEIDAEIYILVNTDVRVTPNWIPPVLTHFDSHPNTAIAQPHLLDDTRKEYFEYAGAAGGFIDQYGFPYCRGRIFNVLEKDNGQYDQDAQVFWASGACFFIRKSIFDQMDGFDDDFFAHQEEIDLCWRVHQKGYAVYAIGKSKVYHLGGGTLQPSPIKVFLNHRNSLYMLLKNLPSNKKLQTLFVRMLLDGVAGIYYLFRGQWKNTLAIIHAHATYYKNKQMFARKRQQKPLSDPYFSQKSIVFSFYLRRIKNFHQLKP